MYLITNVCAFLIIPALITHPTHHKLLDVHYPSNSMQLPLRSHYALTSTVHSDLSWVQIFYSVSLYLTGSSKYNKAII